MDLLGVSGGVGGGSGEGQGRRRPMEGPPQNHQHPPPQTCPRCNSTNTKFCYYNNYSLSQPRYFCKGCRRYWTQGGTLRNVPVGGGCRKSKRPKVSSSDATATSTRQPPLPSHQQQKGGTQLPGMVIGESSRTGASDMVSSMTLNPNPNLNPNPSLNPNVFYPGHHGGGFLSSLAAIQGITSNPGQPVNLGSNLSLLQGLGIPFSTQQQHQQGFYSLAGPGPGLTPSTDWNRALVGNPNPPTPTPETPFWSINSGNGSSINNNNNNNNNTDPGGSNPSQWADFPGSDGA